jgi:hypothetical protein
MSVLPALEPDLDLGADLLHCCAAPIPWDRLRPLGGILIDQGQLGVADDESLAELSTAGVTMGFGVSPVPGSVRNVLDFFDRTGLTPTPILISPPCGMVADYRPWHRVVESLNERLG